MKELLQILEQTRGNGAGVLATVVQVKGSAYRRPGARMLILPDGRRIGSVSGGCLEGDLSRKAWWLTEDGRPVLRTYDTTSDENAVWEFGLGCNGVIDVLLERMDAPETASLIRFLDSATARRETARVATAIRGPFTGKRLWCLQNEVPSGSLTTSPVASTLVGLLAEASNEVVCLDDSEFFLECVDPPQALVLFGAGHDALPLVAIAKELGWHVTVADGRPAYANQDRFPHADRVAVLRPDEPIFHVPSSAAVVLMTHNYPQDLALLPALLKTPPRYLGILGPRSRTDRLFRELGVSPLPNLHAPVGLDIGAGSPETIALAIASEISAVLSSRPGGLLRDRPGPIYPGQAPIASFAGPLRQCG